MGNLGQTVPQGGEGINYPGTAALRDHQRQPETMPLICAVSAIDRDHRASHEAGFVRGEEERQIDDFL